jgi:UDP-N-acetylmuramate--L-alanine ligase/UDP-N-acetylenolpyruvoylglucosamine reductase
VNLLSSQQVQELLAGAPAGATIYLVGAGGCGMSGIGHLLLDLGFRVAGSDLQVNDEVLELRARGAHIHTGHAGEQVEAARPVLLVFTSAVRSGNPELVRADELGIPMARRALALAALVHRQQGVCVAGMHGKTTTSALLAFALEGLGSKPSFAVGWRVPQLPRHARMSPPSGGRLPLFVVEADESDGTLREYHPRHAIVLNVDEEHLDYFADFEAVCREFAQFAAQTSGKVVFCADDERLSALYARLPRAISYGYHPLAAYRIETKFCAPPAQPTGAAGMAVADARVCFEIWHDRRKLGDFHLALLGEKNISNAAAVIALLHQLGHAPEAIAAAIAGFKGAGRRQEQRFRDARFAVYDDYGHHPNEVRATLRAFRSLGPRRLLVAFQPHRFTRTQHLLKEFATAFSGADQLWLMEIYPASEPPIPGVNSSLLAREISAQGTRVNVVADAAQLRHEVRAAMQPGDLVVFLGAGADITVAAQGLAAQLREEPVLPAEEIMAGLSAVLSNEAVLERDEPLASRTTIRIGGKADFYVEPASEEDLAAVLRFCASRRLPFTIFGRGSNLVVRDGGFRGVVVCLAHKGFSRVEVVNGRVHCGAGASLKQIALAAREHKLGGLEFLDGIPGSLGGALRMNAGAMGNWIFEMVETLRLMDHTGRVMERRASELLVEYRGCPWLKNHIALSAVIKCEADAAEAIEQRLLVGRHQRRTTQPRQPSAGCIFKNPEAIPAGRLIDELGLKGTRVGGAVVSDLHANFIVNDGGATARDVLALIAIIQDRARRARGIELETEVEILGED